LQGVTGRPDKIKIKIILLQRITKVVKMTWLINNLSNIYSCQEIPKNNVLKKVITF